MKIDLCLEKNTTAEIFPNIVLTNTIYMAPIRLLITVLLLNSSLSSLKYSKPIISAEIIANTACLYSK